MGRVEQTSNDRIACARWQEMGRDEFFEIAQLRCEVFFVEQRVDVQDFDEYDRSEHTRHYWIRDGLGCAAYLRSIVLEASEFGATHSFGRVAVRRDRRGEGLARRLVKACLSDLAGAPVVIHSQAYVVDLYAAFGFHVVGEPFDEAGIPHRTMLRHEP